MRVNNIIVFLFISLNVQSYMVAKEKTVMVFGVFDLLHEGHRSFLTQAATCGDHLIVVVTPDSVVQLLKKRLPHDNQTQRMHNVKTIINCEVVLGDTVMGTYGVVRKYHPDIICLGYDQEVLGNDLKQRMVTGNLPVISLLTLKPYKPELCHTSLLLTEQK